MPLSVALVCIYLATKVISQSLTNFTLITDPLMPYYGRCIVPYVNATAMEIWLFSPYQSFDGSYNPTNYVFKYDINNGSFEIQSPTPDTMNLYGSHQSVFIDDIVYFNNRGTDDIGSYQLSNKQWTVPINASIPINIQRACLATDGRYLYAMGGAQRINGSYVTIDHFQVMDIVNNIWFNDTPKLNFARQQSACIIKNGSIYLFGGWNGITSTNAYDSIETIYVGVGDQVPSVLTNASWSVLDAVMNVGRRGLSAVNCDQVDQDLIYLIAGYGSPYLDSIEIFRISDQTITMLNVTLNIERHMTTAICFGPYIYIFGGSTFDQVSLDSWERSNILYTLEPTADPSAIPTIVPTIYPTLFPSTDPTSQPLSEGQVSHITSSPSYYSTTPLHEDSINSNGLSVPQQRVAIISGIVLLIVIIAILLCILDRKRKRKRLHKLVISSRQDMLSNSHNLATVNDGDNKGQIPVCNPPKVVNNLVEEDEIITNVVESPGGNAALPEMFATKGHDTMDTSEAANDLINNDEFIVESPRGGSALPQMIVTKGNDAKCTANGALIGETVEGE